MRLIRPLLLLFPLYLGFICPSQAQITGPAPAAGAKRATATSESWSSLTLAGSDLAAMPPLTLERDSHQDFSREMVRVQWRDADPIYLFVMTPNGVKKPPVILYLYNYIQDTERFRDEHFCQFITRNGFAAVGFSAALSGHRYHDRPMKEWFVSELPESLAVTTHDVEMIINYLGARGDIDVSRVGMFGEGSGGTVAVLAASADPRIKAIDLLDPWGDWPDWFATSTRIPPEERDSFMKPEFLKKVELDDPIRYLPNLTIPVRYQYLNVAGTTPQKARDRIQAALPKQAVSTPKDKALAAYKLTNGADYLDWLKQQVHIAGTTNTTKLDTRKDTPTHE